MQICKLYLACFHGVRWFGGLTSIFAGKSLKKRKPAFKRVLRLGEKTVRASREYPTLAAKARRRWGTRCRGWLELEQIQSQYKRKTGNGKSKNKSKYGDSSPFDYAQGQNNERFIVPLIVSVKLL